jgi:hypothetical protein
MRPRTGLAPSISRAIAFGFSDLSVAVIPAQAGIKGRVTGFGALDSRFCGNDRGEKGNSLAKCDCPASISGGCAVSQMARLETQRLVGETDR